MARKHSDTFKELRGHVSIAYQETRGPEKHVVGAMGSLLHGIELLSEDIQEVGKAVDKFEAQVTRFALAADKSEKTMKWITIVGVVVAAAQLVLAWVIFKHG